MIYNYDNRQMLVSNNKIVLVDKYQYTKVIKEYSSEEEAIGELHKIASELYLEEWHENNNKEVGRMFVNFVSNTGGYRIA